MFEALLIGLLLFPKFILWVLGIVLSLFILLNGISLIIELFTPRNPKQINELLKKSNRSLICNKPIYYHR